jgi:hypothetical protein
MVASLQFVQATYVPFGDPKENEDAGDEDDVDHKPFEETGCEMSGYKSRAIREIWGSRQVQRRKRLQRARSIRAPACIVQSMLAGRRGPK